MITWLKTYYTPEGDMMHPMAEGEYEIQFQDLTEAFGAPEVYIPKGRGKTAYLKINADKNDVARVLAKSDWNFPFEMVATPNLKRHKKI